MNNANAVLSTSRYFIKNRFRISMNYLFDEFVLIQISKLVKSMEAYSLDSGLLNNKKRILNLYLSLITVGTPTFRHSSYSNFVSGYEPLGWVYGSDELKKT